MPDFTTYLRLHGQVRHARCLLCGAVHGQCYVGVILAEGSQAVGDVCPRCLSEPPRLRARAIGARARRLGAEVGEALSRAEALREEGAQARGRVQADRRQREADRRRRAKDWARREADRRQRMAWPGPAAPDPEPATAEEKEHLAALLLALAEGLGGLPQWPTSLAELEQAEVQAVQVQFPELPEEVVSRCVENRYRDLIAGTA